MSVWAYCHQLTCVCAIYRWTLRTASKEISNCKWSVLSWVYPLTLFPHWQHRPLWPAEWNSTHFCWARHRLINCDWCFFFLTCALENHFQLFVFIHSFPLKPWRSVVVVVVVVVVAISEAVVCLMWQLHHCSEALLRKWERCFLWRWFSSLLRCASLALLSLLGHLCIR